MKAKIKILIVLCLVVALELSVCGCIAQPTPAKQVSAEAAPQQPIDNSVHIDNSVTIDNSVHIETNININLNVVWNVSIAQQAQPVIPTNSTAWDAPNVWDQAGSVLNSTNATPTTTTTAPTTKNSTATPTTAQSAQAYFDKLNQQYGNESHAIDQKMTALWDKMIKADPTLTEESPAWGTAVNTTITPLRTALEQQSGVPWYELSLGYQAAYIANLNGTGGAFDNNGNALNISDLKST